jgi:hypothetical protein
MRGWSLHPPDYLYWDTGPMFRVLVVIFRPTLITAAHVEMCAQQGIHAWLGSARHQLARSYIHYERESVLIYLSTRKIAAIVAAS